MYDVIIKGGVVFDGTGRDPIRMDIGITDGRIARLEQTLEGAYAICDASRLFVAPGFIDVHSHSDACVTNKLWCAPKVMQGITTEVVGNCGMSLHPWSELGKPLPYLEAVLGTSTPTLYQRTSEYLTKVAEVKTLTNIATLIGHGTLRSAVMGLDLRPPLTREMIAMKRNLAAALEEGAMGISFGLGYLPGTACTPEEIVDLCHVVAKHSGVAAFHIRSYGKRYVESVQEVIDVACATGCKVHISHNKPAGRPYWGTAGEVLGLLNEALASGISVSSDVYPFIRGSSSILSLFPPWTLRDGVNSLLEFLCDPETKRRVVTDLEQGCSAWESRVAIMGWDRIWIGSVKKKENSWVAGRSVADCARNVGLPPTDFLIGLMLSEAKDFNYTGEISSLRDIEIMMAYPFTLVGTDGIHAVDGISHPRLYGTFPRMFSELVKKLHLLSWEGAIHRMTKHAAQIFGLSEVGVLREGYYADIVVFDPENTSYEEVYDRPPVRETGIKHVFISGKEVVGDGKLTGVTAGRVMRCKDS